MSKSHQHAIPDFSGSFLRFTPVDNQEITNKPRFQLESLARVHDAKGQSIRALYHGNSCKAEDTFNSPSFLVRDNYDFAPVIADSGHYLIFRRHAFKAMLHADETRLARSAMQTYRQIGQPGTLPWGRLDLDLAQASQVYPLVDIDQMEAAFQAGHRVVGRTEYQIHPDGSTVVLEYPVKLLNIKPDNLKFQIDTGPVVVVLPTVSADGDLYEHVFMAYIGFNDFEHCELLVAKPEIVGQVMADGSLQRATASQWRRFLFFKRPAKTYDFVTVHFSEIVYLDCRNSLFALAG